MDVFGSKQAQYFDVIEDGLRDERGIVLFLPAKFEAVTRQIQALERRKELNQNLMMAVSAGKTGDAKTAIADGAEVNADALILAIELGEQHSDIVRMILKTKSNWSIQFPDGPAEITITDVGIKYCELWYLFINFRTAPFSSNVGHAGKEKPCIKFSVYCSNCVEKIFENSIEFRNAEERDSFLVLFDQVYRRWKERYKDVW